MTRLRGMIVCAGVSLGLTAGMALAVPPVLEKAPKDAMFVIAIPSADKLEKDLQSLTTAAELNLPIPGVEMALTMGGISGGLDMTKGFAMVIMPPAPGQPAAADPDELDGRTIAMLPITDYAAFLENFSAKPGEAGSVETVNVNGNEQFARNLGDGYAIMSPTKELISGFKAGNPTVKADMGKLGERISDTADIVLLVNMEVARPMIEAGAKAAKDRMAEQMATMGVEGGGGNNALSQWFTDALVSDAKTVVGGIKAGGLGASFEMAANFKEGSPMAAAFQAAGNAGALLGKLPNTPYLFAGAIDTSSPGVKKMMQDIAAKTKESAAPDAPDMFGGAMAQADGQAIVVGNTPMMMGGIFNNTVGFTASREPAKVIANFKTELESLNGKSFQGMSYETTFKEGAAKVGEKAVDVWQVKMIAQDGEGMSSQAASVMFGPQGGPGGYLSPVDGGVVRTFAKNTALMSAAMKTASGQGENLSSETLLKQVGGQLPSGRIAEGYVGVRHIVDMVLPMAAAFGVEVDMNAIPAQLPPIGVALAGEGGSAHMSLFLPAPVIKTAWVVASPLAEGMGGPGDMGEEPEADQPTGQPRF